MGFTELEKFGKQALEQFPAVKHAAKRVYQTASVLTDFDRIKSEGSLVRMTPDDGYEYFYGYYDKSPWDASERYMICLRVNQAFASVAPKDPGTVCLIDTADHNRIIEVGKTHSWNVQQGCMAQWLGPDYRERIIYNDCRDHQYVSVIFNVETMTEEKVLPMAVYDVSPDGTYGLSLDFSRLHRLRPGYGYSNIPDVTKNELCPLGYCIWKIDFESGIVKGILRYDDFASFEPDSTMNGAEHKVNHIMISPNGKRFMVLHRWFKNKRKHTRLVTVNIDGTDMYNLSDDTFVSHCFWKNDNEILSFCRKNAFGDHYYLMQDKTHNYKLLWPELNTDGHCSYNPDRSYVITDTYPNRKRIASVYLCNENGNTSKRIARVFSPFKYDNDCRCDLHPRWNRSGTKICIDSVHEGKRALYVMPVDFSLPDSEKIEEKKKIVYFVTRLKKSGPVGQTLDLVRKLDRDVYQPVIVALYKEDSSNSMLSEFKKAGCEYFCLEMSRADSILRGGRKASEFFKVLKPDLIHSVGMPLYKIALHYKGCPNFTTIHNYVFEDYPVKYGKQIGTVMANQDLKLIRENARYMVACSKSLSDIYLSKHNIRIDFIRNGVDTDRYQVSTDNEKAEARKKLNLPENKTICVFTGQVTSRKNQRFASDAIYKLNRKDLCLVLLGDGPELQTLKGLYEDSCNIIFAGRVNNVPDYLKAADFYISSSTSEGLPVGALEAMASGLPLFLSDIIQHKEVVEAGDDIGFIFKNNDYKSFEENLDLLLSRDLKKMGANSRKTAETLLSAKLMTEKYEEKYQELLVK